jgi:hypothetical protein
MTPQGSDNQPALPDEEAAAITRASSSATSDPGRPEYDKSFLQNLKEYFDAVIAALALILKGGGKHRRRKPRPWHIFLSAEGLTDTPPPDAQIEKMMDRHQALGDFKNLAEFASQFRLPESDFFGDPAQVERLTYRLLRENPPWMHLNRVLDGGEAGSESHSQEVLYREQEVHVWEEAELFFPDDTWKDRPLASHTMRPAKGLEEVWQARLLDQVMPPRVIVDKWTRGEIMVPIRNPNKLRLDFRKEIRRVETVRKQQMPIPIESESGAGKGGQLLYILLDFSASMRGSGAVVAMAVITAAMRSNMGQTGTRYLYRRYAQKEQMWPERLDHPLIASTLQQKDALLATIMKTNFNGSATDVNDALTIASQDIEALRTEGGPDAEILLVTDGRAEMLESTRLTLLKARVKVHTVMVVPEPNPELEKLSASFTALDFGIDIDSPLLERHPKPEAVEELDTATVQNRYRL